MATIGKHRVTALIAEQRGLEARLRDLEGTPQQALAAGRALLAFAALEHDVFSTVAPLLDPAAQAELAAEHRLIAEDLELLRWLLATMPGSPDIPALTDSLIRRMRDHVERDGRFLSRAATLHS